MADNDSDIKNLKVGDVVISYIGLGEKEVIEIIGRIIFLLSIDGCSTFTTIEEMKRYGYRLKNKVEEEMTMEQINKALGKTVKVVE